MAPRLRKALLYGRTLRHLTPPQIYWRLRYRLWPRRARRYHAPQPLPAPDTEARDGLRAFAAHWRGAAPSDAALADAFLLGRFTFLNKTVKSSNPRWSGLDVAKLWLYHLHYFDYARDIALCDPDPAGAGAAQVRAWMLDWIEKNADHTDPAWDAFPLSVRLINWSLVLAVYGWDDFQLRESMHLQLDYLRHHLERDLAGNHLLKNAVALTVAGTLLNSAHLDAGLALLQEEVRAQILPDGGHVERSPMYHGQVLLDLLLAVAVSRPRPDWLAEAAERAIAFLHGVTHGDGLAAQFNDGAAEEGPSPAAVLALSRLYCPGIAPPAASMACPDSGLYRLAPGGDAGVLIAKAGKSTLDRQPGHAHSDLLSFEYSLGAQRIFVNAGTHGYAGSGYRDYCRSTAAHNTLRINGGEQLEHWSTFRVARRIHGAVTSWEPERPALCAAYRTLHGPPHERAFAWDPRGWWRIVDTITGRGPLAVERFLHLHPNCAAAALPPCGDCARYGITYGGQTLTLLVAGAGSIALARGQEAPPQGWYFPRFGEAVAATALVMETDGRDMLRLGYALIPGAADPACAAADLTHALTETPGNA